jgi:hypothetical protein
MYAIYDARQNSCHAASIAIAAMRQGTYASILFQSDEVAIGAEHQGTSGHDARHRLAAGNLGRALFINDASW